MSRQNVSHRIGDGGIGNHADLDGIDADVGKDRIDLVCHENGGHGVDTGDALCVLRRQGSQNGHSVNAASGKGLQIGLDAGAARRVGAGDG
jgi:hypothetical protein